jgi:hypothetical protein
MDLVVDPFPGLKFLIELRQSIAFELAARLFRLERQEDHEKALDLLTQLSSEGHIESTHELFFICLDQNDLGMAAEFLDQEKIDANHPTVIYLKALLLKEQGTFDVSAFAKAANAGSAMAAIRLIDHFLPTDREEAKKWLTKAKKIGHKYIEHYQKEIELFPREKGFVIIEGSDDSNTYTEVRVYSKANFTLIEKFNDSSEAINFCLKESQNLDNAGFEFRDTGDDWPDESELAVDDSFNVSCTVTPEKEEIAIWRDSEQLWLGSIDEMSEAIEYLIENVPDDWWEVVYCDYEKFEEDEEVEEVEEDEEDKKVDLTSGAGYSAKGSLEKLLVTANSSSTSPDVLEKLISHDEVEIRCAIAWNKNTTVNLLDQLAKDISEEVRYCVASNSNLHLKALMSLSQDESDFVKDQARFKLNELASNPHTSKVTLAKIAESEDYFTRRCVAMNPNTDPELLEILAKDLHEYVRSDVANNPNTSSKTLAALAKDDDVRDKVAGNANVDRETLAMLAQDDDRYVRKCVAGNQITGPEILASLAKDEDDDVRANVAQNPNANPQVLEMLAKDDYDDARANVAQNPNANSKVLAMLAQDDDDNIRESVAINPNSSPETLAMLAEDDDEYIRRSVAMNPNTTPEVLASLATDDDEDVRSNVAENPNSSPETLAMLLEEDDECDLDLVNLSPEDFHQAGFFKFESERTYIGDPSEIEKYLKNTPEENDVWTTLEGLNLFDFGDTSLTEEKNGIVYVEKNDEGRIVRSLISFDGEFEDDLTTKNFVVGNWLCVNSGQLMVGDPTFLENWETDDGEEWSLEGKIGKFSYQGACATTIAHDYGVLADGKSVVFNTGYGDGNFYVFFLIKNQSGETLGFDELQAAGYTSWLTGFATGVPPGCEISKVVIDFITKVE